jgi:putative SOS response-associated peptidase YedK
MTSQQCREARDLAVPKAHNDIWTVTAGIGTAGSLRRSRAGGGRYNVPPTTVIDQRYDAERVSNGIEQMRWGPIPFWSHQGTNTEG